MKFDLDGWYVAGAMGNSNFGYNVKCTLQVDGSDIIERIGFEFTMPTYLPDGRYNIKYVCTNVVEDMENNCICGDLVASIVDDEGNFMEIMNETDFVLVKQ